MVHEWKGVVLLITGASKGIGSLVVRLALEEGAKHVVVIDIDEKSGVALQNELNVKYGAGKVKFIKCDVSNEEQLKESFDLVLSDKENTYAVVNNAGILNDSLRTYRKQIDINVGALITGSLKALDLMRKDKGGKGGTIINMASTAALVDSPYTPIYSATKSAVLTFSTQLGMDEYFLRTGVRVLTICFGVTDTGLIQLTNMGSFDEEMEKQLSTALSMFPGQRPESAAQGVIDMFKKGASGSTWLSNASKPVEDITYNIKKAYNIMSEPLLAE